MPGKTPTLGDFLNHEGETFTLSQEDGEDVEVQLVQVDTTRDLNDDHERFTLEFAPVGDTRPNSAMYDVRHAELAEFPMTISAIVAEDADTTGPTHEAVFDRPKSFDEEEDARTDGGGLQSSETVAGQPLVGEIRTFGFGYAPQGWMRCHGQIVPIQQHTALYSLLGTTYGGDGRTSFALPKLGGRFPMNQGGQGSMQYTMGRLGGSEEVTLTTEQMPSHTHAADLGVPAIDEEGNVESPVGNALAEIPNSYGAKKAYSDKSTSKTTSIGGSLEDTGGNDAHSNMPPYQVVNYSIAMTGVYPQRS